MSTIATIRRPTSGSNAAVGQKRNRPISWLARVLAAYGWIDDRLEKRRSRRSLAEMSEYQLKDIGLSRADAVREAARSFWD